MSQLLMIGSRARECTGEKRWFHERAKCGRHTWMKRPRTWYQAIREIEQPAKNFYGKIIFLSDRVTQANTGQSALGILSELNIKCFSIPNMELVKST